MTRRLKIYYDGGCRPNSVPMEAAVVVRGRIRFFDDLGIGSNTAAEWQALLCAITMARDFALHDAEFVGDSRDVTRQANLAASTGLATSAQTTAFLALLAQYQPGRIRWIKREQNLAGVALQARHAR